MKYTNYNAEKYIELIKNQQTFSVMTITDLYMKLIFQQEFFRRV